MNYLYGSSSFYGIEGDVIDRSIRRARRERSEALWNLLKQVFSRPVAAEIDPGHPAGEIAHRAH